MSLDADRVKNVRRAAGYSQNQAAVAAGVSMVSWRMFEARADSVSEPVQAKCQRAVAAMEQKVAEKVPEKVA
jgi:hypothetical protein